MPQQERWPSPHSLLGVSGWPCTHPAFPPWPADFLWGGARPRFPAHFSGSWGQAGQLALPTAAQAAWPLLASTLTDSSLPRAKLDPKETRDEKAPSAPRETR